MPKNAVVTDASLKNEIKAKEYRRDEGNQTRPVSVGNPGI
jgi:hypothetical protein